MAYGDIRLNPQVVTDTRVIVNSAVAIINDAVQDLSNSLKQLDLTWRSFEAGGAAQQFAEAQRMALLEAGALKTLYQRGAKTMDDNANEIQMADAASARYFPRG